MVVKVAIVAGELVRLKKLSPELVQIVRIPPLVYVAPLQSTRRLAVLYDRLDPLFESGIERHRFCETLSYGVFHLAESAGLATFDPLRELEQLPDLLS